MFWPRCALRSGLVLVVWWPGDPTRASSRVGLHSRHSHSSTSQAPSCSGQCALNIMPGQASGNNSLGRGGEDQGRGGEGAGVHCPCGCEWVVQRVQWFLLAGCPADGGWERADRGLPTVSWRNAAWAGPARGRRRRAVALPAAARLCSAACALPAARSGLQCASGLGWAGSIAPSCGTQEPGAARLMKFTLSLHANTLAGGEQSRLLALGELSHVWQLIKHGGQVDIKTLDFQRYVGG